MAPSVPAERALGLGLPLGDRRDARGYWHRLVVGMTDPLERIRYDDPDAPALFPTPVDAADQAYERARDERIEAFE